VGGKVMIEEECERLSKKREREREREREK